MARKIKISIILLLILIVVSGCSLHKIITYSPKVIYFYNTPQLAKNNHLEQNECGATNKAFESYIYSLADKIYDYTHIEFFMKHHCIQYAVIHLRQKN